MVEKIVKKTDIVKVMLTFFIPFLFAFIKPIDLNITQAIVFGTLLMVIVWWATEWVNKSFACAVLLLVFLIFSGTGFKNVFNFVLSENIIMIVAAFLLSQGIVNSGVTRQFTRYCVERFCTTGIHFVLVSAILTFIMMLFVPQPFARVVMLSAIYADFLKNCDIEEESKSILMFSVFVFVPVTSMIFLSGDVTGNYIAMQAGQVTFTFIEWAKYMAVPGIVSSAIVTVAFILTFKKALRCRIESDSAKETFKSNKDGIVSLGIMFLVVLLWSTESLHGINATVIAVIGVVLMYVTHLLSICDFKVIDLELLLFITAAFSIGRTLIGSGIGEKVKGVLMPLLPDVSSIWFVPIIALAIIFLHDIMGSVACALSFSIPMLGLITEGYWTPELIPLFVIAITYFQYIMPFNQVVIMIGYGKGYYSVRHVIKIGIILTIVTMITLMFVFIPWWKITGLM